MKKLLVFAAFAAVTSTAVAQAQGGPPDRPMRGMGRGAGRSGPGAPGMMLDRTLLSGITLTDEQKTKLDQIRQAEREKMQQAGGPGADFEAMREAREKGDTATLNRLMAEQRTRMDARRDGQIATIRGILNADQLTQFDANLAELKKREAEVGLGRGARGRGGRPPNPPGI